MKKRTGRGSEPELTFNFRRRERLVVARSLCSLRSLASFFRFFGRKKNLPAMFYSAELLSKRSPLGAVWCVLTGSGRGREREGKRKRKKESERTAKRAPASSSLPSKKGGAPLLLSILPRSPPLAPGASESTHTRPDGVGLAKKSLCVCHELSERGRQKIVFFSSHRFPFSPHSRQLKQQASRPRQEAQQGQDHERQRGGDLVGERARERERERDK